MTTKLKLILVAAMCATGFVAQTATATGREMYVNIDGIAGESTDANHKHWIDVIGFSHGVESPGVFEPFTFKHLVDSATPKLQEACAKGSTAPHSVELQVCRMVASQQQVVYKVKFENIKLTGSTVSTEELADGSFRMVEEVKMLAGKQTWTVTSVRTGGSTEASYTQQQ